VSAEITHIAGPDLTVSGRYLRQRCSWCGALLLDYDLANLARPLEPGEDPENPEPWRPGTFEVGSLVRVAGAFESGGWTSFERVELEPHENGDGRLPEGACALLDPVATA
jgi:hypothetical protein